MSIDVTKIRNIGISAHIDSGKTTLTERILFYTNRIHAIHDVKGKDGVGAKMDSMDLERERGITIQSAATHCEWRVHTPSSPIAEIEHHINIIDTPGHVDFTIEVERSLRVLDGAILVLCGVAGVQSQSLTVDRQMRRYNVPRVAFVNKLDRQGANPYRVKDQLIEKLNHNAVMVQIPIGTEHEHVGVIDLIEMRACYFDGDNGEGRRYEPIPAEMQAQAEEYRTTLLDAASMFSDELTEAMLEETVTPQVIRLAVRRATIARQMTPVFMGSAYKNKAVQELLDGVLYFLPDPTEVVNMALDLEDDEKPVQLVPDSSKNFVGLAFKLEDGKYGQLTYLRVYQGALRKGEFIHNMYDRRKVKVGRLVRMHSNEMDDIDESEPGDIVAMFGIDCRSGDTFTDGEIRLSMTSMFVPEPVIHLTITAKDAKSTQNLSKALQRFTKEDPTFRVHTDPETNETIISGMGELHLEVYVERMKREYSVEVVTSPPRVAYRETVTKRADFNYTHKKQTGGSGQFGRVAGYMEPTAEGETDYVFNDQIVGGVIPREFIPSCDKGFRSMLAKGRLIGMPVNGVKMTINDGSYHAVDSSDIAFQEAARGAWRDAYNRAGPTILEPLMKVEVDGPAEFQGAIIGTLNQRRGVILGSTEEDGYCKVEAEVPLSEMFGYSTVIRSSTQGKAEFTMEFSRYDPVPKAIAEDLIRKFQEEQAKK